MTTETSDIKSVEEYSIYALERTAEGLETLCDDSRACGQAISTGDLQAIPKVSSLAVSLHDFDIFQNELCTFLMLNTEDISDEIGSLAETQRKFKDTLDEMATRIGAGNISHLAELLKDDLPDVLTRFKKLLPQLRDFIKNEYLQPA